MSSIWTPDGEHSVNPSARPTPEPEVDVRTPAGFGDREEQPMNEQTPDQADLEALQQELARTPAEVVVANHCFGLFELAALHLSQAPPQLEQAQLAIDALGALVESLSGRLGDPEPQLREGLNQLRMAYVTVRQGVAAAASGPDGAGPSAN